MDLIKPIASVKKLSLTLTMALDTPVYATGDEKRLMQIILIILGNAVKFTKEGYVAIEASVAKPEYIRGCRPSEYYPQSTDGHFYLRVQVSLFLSLQNVILVIWMKSRLCDPRHLK